MYSGMKAPVSTVWKLRVHDAVITNKLLYGLESASSAETDYARLGAFQVKGPKMNMNTPHLYYSRVPNESVMEIANQRLTTAGRENMKTMSKR